ncbi:hypothetical protein ACEQ8H_004034 [Pleosporales sp. CAS-2024a]
MAFKDDVHMMDATSKPQDASDYADLIQTNHTDAFAFSPTEELALHLHHQLKELELEQSLLQAQRSARVVDSSALPDDELQAQLTIAEREAMEAKAEYEIRNKIIHNVLAMDPTLKAVHGGERTGLGEKRLRPMITENDTVSMIHGSLASKLLSTQRAISTIRQANMAASRKNREMAAEMLALAEEMKAQSAKDIEDPRLRDQISAVEKELKESRRRMKTLKGVLSAMIVGSGINWAADDGLSQLVMDDEEDG